jgi:hypothetical protein
MSKYLGTILVVVLASIVLVFAAVEIHQPLIKTVPITKTVPKYRVVLDSGKVLKCDSLQWKSYDTMIPFAISKTILVYDTLRHKHIDTMNAKK